jgi:hypothetical protein
VIYMKGASVYLLVAVVVVVILIGVTAFGFSYSGSVVDQPSDNQNDIPGDVPVPPPDPTPPPAPQPPPPEPPPEPDDEPVVISVGADDNMFDPPVISVDEGDAVRLTFNVDSNRVYFGGLDFRSPEFNTGKVLPGESTTVEFTAQESFTVTSYWPSSGVKKADLSVVVNG